MLPNIRSEIGITRMQSVTRKMVNTAAHLKASHFSGNLGRLSSNSATTKETEKNKATHTVAELNRPNGMIAIMYRTSPPKQTLSTRI